MGVGETITVINKSGKIVSSSRHIIDVFKEAKSAYRERKAEIRAERHAAQQQEKKLRDGIRALQLQDAADHHDDVRSRASSRRSKGTHRSSKPHRHHDGEPKRSSTHHHHSQRPLRYDYTSYDLDPPASEPPPLTRRHTDLPLRSPPPFKPVHSHHEPHIDMDLAYGDLPPPSPTAHYDEDELKSKASKLTRLLEEANCLQHSVTTTIDSLQKNPDALAAVALTLAEISNIVGKMGPGVLTVLKGSFPAVAALLVSPQFMIAAGVGIGVTIVALGGYKIIKKIQATQSEPILEEPWRAGPVGGAGDGGMGQLEELETQELSRIEVWRRGIADVEAESAGTTVDGEFITPGASRHLVAAGVLDEEEVRSRRKSRVGKEDGESRSGKSHRAKSTKSSAKSSASRSKSTKEKSKKKEPSGLRMLFRSHTAH